MPKSLSIIYSSIFFLLALLPLSSHNIAQAERPADASGDTGSNPKINSASCNNCHKNISEDSLTPEYSNKGKAELNLLILLHQQLTGDRPEDSKTASL